MKIPVYDFFHDFLEKHNSISMSINAGSKGLGKFIEIEDLAAPTYLFMGFSHGIKNRGLCFIGEIDSKFYHKLIKDGKNKFEKTFRLMLKKHPIPAFIFPADVHPDKLFISLSNEFSIPLIIISEKESTTKKLLTTFLEDRFAQRLVVHGDFVEVFGIGILITGESGIGKSETALDLVKRGHRLIADDMVVIKKMSGNFLFGTGSEIAKHYMEIRGIGIIDIAKLYGIRAIREKKRLDLKVMLVNWESTVDYDRLGIVDKHEQIIDIDIPTIIIPVKPGRNIPGIIETSALNFRIKQIGINSATMLNHKLINWMQNEKKIKMVREFE